MSATSKVFNLLARHFNKYTLKAAKVYITAEQTGSVACETLFSSRFHFLAGNWDTHTSVEHPHHP